ncbi:E1A-binding protein p400-like [Pezoporus wallicus]|uniref:E1A-binding protein p400-like n=1 Tax=Pezoporus wallicus TaxID=35540 RepID=UPI0025502D77|nr:E1A-binding protein p400-like [Pezoporus wallicus]
MKLTEHVKTRTQEYLRSGHFVGVLHVLTQMLRVCNHPDPLSPWLPSSSCVLDMLEFTIASLVLNALEWDLWKHADQSVFDVIGIEHQTTYKAQILLKLKITRKLIEEICCSPSSPVKLKPNRPWDIQYLQPYLFYHNCPWSQHTQSPQHPAFFFKQQQLTEPVVTVDPRTTVQMRLVTPLISDLFTRTSKDQS